MKKKKTETTTIIFLGIILLGIGVWLFLNREKSILSDQFVQCLVDRGMVVYASKTCPACNQFAQELGGYNKVESLFVECSENQERCANEMKTRFVPEIQINGEVYQGPRDIESLSRITGCEL